MIAYDQLVDGLPERVGELTIRLRDLVLSLGAGVTDRMAPGALDFEVGGKFARLAPDSAGVTLSLLGPLGSPLPDLNGRLTPHAKGAVLRMTSAADVDDDLRRLLKDAYTRAAARGMVKRPVVLLDLPKDQQEALDGLSRGLRLWMHTLQVMQKMERQRAYQESRAGQKRSHKKKPTAAPPVLELAPAAEPVVTPPAPPARAAKPKPARSVKQKKKVAPRRAPAKKAAGSKPAKKTGKKKRR